MLLIGQPCFLFRTVGVATGLIVGLAIGAAMSIVLKVAIGLSR